MLAYFGLTVSNVCLAVLEGIKPSLLLVGGEHFVSKW